MTITGPRRGIRMGVDLASGPSYTVYRVYYGDHIMTNKQEQTKGKHSGPQLNPVCFTGVILLDNDMKERKYQVALARVHFLNDSLGRQEIARRILDGPKWIDYDIIYNARSEGSRRYILWNGAKAEILL